MALVECRECGKEMSDHAKICPNCGIENNIIFCPECNKQLSSKAIMCPSCGYGFKEDIKDYSGSKSKQRNFGLAVAGFVCSGIGCLLINPLGLLSILGIIFCSIAVSTNPKEEKETLKAVWNYKNKARGFGICGLWCGIIGLIWYVVNFIITFS